MSDKGRVLIVAGSDSGGGAGIQADIKTVTALSGYAMTAITALTAQNTLGVQGIYPIPADFVVRQMESVLDDIGVDAVKIGMLSSVEIIAAVADTLRKKAPGIPVVLDPVMVAKGGASLLAEDAVKAMRDLLIPLSAIVTPNAPEAEALSGMTVRTLDDMARCARALMTLGPGAVLLKGGHLEGADVADLLLAGDDHEFLVGKRIETRNTHGTGCTLASGIACGLAQGLDMPAAVKRARAYLREAIRSAPGFGSGHGPINHAHTVKPFSR